MWETQNLFQLQFLDLLLKIYPINQKNSCFNFYHYYQFYYYNFFCYKFPNVKGQYFVPIVIYFNRLITPQNCPYFNYIPAIINLIFYFKYLFNFQALGHLYCNYLYFTSINFSFILTYKTLVCLSNYQGYPPYHSSYS